MVHYLFSFGFSDHPTALLLLYGSYCIDAMIRPSILYLRLKINVWARLFYYLDILLAKASL